MLREFAEDLKKKICVKLGDGFDIRINHIVKNNGVNLEGIVILRKGENIAPTIYVNNYYTQFSIGRQMESIIAEIISLYKDTALPKLDSFGEEILSFCNMQDKIIFRLIHYEKNKKELDTTPHIPFLDLAITFYCFVHKTSEMLGTVRVTWELMEKWGLDMDMLWERAKVNTPRLFPYQIFPIEEVLNGMQKEDANISEESQFIPKVPMYVLSNQSGVHGAAVLLYEDVLKSIANTYLAGTYPCDFYILPSSIHEVILVPCQEDDIKENLCKIVCEVNDTEVSEDEILSDSVYIYKSKFNVFEILKK